jgi:SNF2 family DNA or RNA helicase
MSGTPIQNNAGEYFTVLNLIRSMMFPHYSKFIENDCDSYNGGYGYKVGGLRHPEAFHEKTRDFILRRTKAEVLPDLPALMRKFKHVEFDGKFKKAYLEQLDKLEDLMYGDNNGSFASGGAKIAIMTKMREITGVAKVENCIDHTIEFLESCDRKLVIFTHHHSATNLLITKLNQYLEENHLKGCIHLSASLNGDERQAVAVKFKENPEYRVMIASTLAAGEGINLQFCADAIMLERQWNPANEEQAEGRFHRFGQVHPVSVNYMIASETIDEYFTELVESKRAIVASTLDNKEIQWNEASLMQELATILVTRGKKAWKL